MRLKLFLLFQHQRRPNILFQFHQLIMAGVGGGFRYYAVRSGRKPGIYLSWSECEANTRGFSNAVYKKFDSHEEAEKFVEGDALSSSATTTTIVPSSLATTSDQSNPAVKVGKKKKSKKVVTITDTSVPIIKVGKASSDRVVVENMQISSKSSVVTIEGASPVTSNSHKSSPKLKEKLATTDPSEPELSFSANNGNSSSDANNKATTTVEGAPPTATSSTPKVKEKMKVKGTTKKIVSPEGKGGRPTTKEPLSAAPDTSSTGMTKTDEPVKTVDANEAPSNNSNNNPKVKDSPMNDRCENERAKTVEPVKAVVITEASTSKSSSSSKVENSPMNDRFQDEKAKTDEPVVTEGPPNNSNNSPKVKEKGKQELVKTVDAAASSTKKKKKAKEPSKAVGSPKEKPTIQEPAIVDIKEAVIVNVEDAQKTTQDVVKETATKPSDGSPPSATSSSGKKRPSTKGMEKPAKTMAVAATATTKNTPPPPVKKVAQVKKSAKDASGEIGPFVLIPHGGTPATVIPPEMIVYVDGSCRFNGESLAYAGYGVHWPAVPERDLHAALSETETHTNQRAELHAIIGALRGIQDVPGDLEIRSDSAYVISGLTHWAPRWASMGWVKRNVINMDLFKEALRLGEDRRRANPNTRIYLRHVAAHRGEPGNEAADRLARRGAAINRQSNLQQ